MLRTLVLVTLLTTALAGCADKAVPNEEPDDAAAPETITLQGRVQDLAVVPLPGANVTVLERELTVVTDAEGGFVIADLPKAFYTVRAEAAGHRGQTLTFSPLDPRDLLFVLPRLPEAARQVPLQFNGFIQCAAEYLIITPSCDSVTEEAYHRGVPLPNGGSVTDDTTEFAFPVEDGWQTIVADVVFDLEGHPGLEALRATVSGTNDANALTDYEQYGRFTGATTYTFHLSPGGEYPDGLKPVPQNATGFRFNMYGQGHGWHALCEPPVPPGAPMCPLGLGAAVDMDFQLLITIFYGRPAPDGWSSLAA